MNEELKKLKKECESFKLSELKFKEQDGSISNALHIPYSGMGSNCEYVEFNDYMQDDVYSIILEVLGNNEDIEDLDELKEAIESYDDDGSFHQFVESSLTWQQGLRDSDIIINNLSDYEETDSGLWDGQQPEEAITSKAFWTYKSALLGNILKEIEEFEE